MRPSPVYFPARLWCSLVETIFRLNFPPSSELHKSPSTLLHLHTKLNLSSSITQLLEIKHGRLVSRNPDLGVYVRYSEGIRVTFKWYLQDINIELITMFSKLRRWGAGKTSQRKKEDLQKNPDSSLGNETRVSLLEFVTALSAKNQDDTKYVSADEAEDEVKPLKNILDELETSRVNETRSETPREPEHLKNVPIGTKDQATDIEDAGPQQMGKEKTAKRAFSHLRDRPSLEGIAASTPISKNKAAELASSPVKRKRYKKYERNKRRFIINPSSESEEEEQPPTNGNSQIFSSQVELLANGSTHYNELEEEMLEDLIRQEEEQLRLERLSRKSKKHKHASKNQSSLEGEIGGETSHEGNALLERDLELREAEVIAQTPDRAKRKKLNKKRKSKTRKHRREGKHAAAPDASVPEVATPDSSPYQNAAEPVTPEVHKIIPQTPKESERTVKPNSSSKSQSASQKGTHTDSRLAINSSQEVKVKLEKPSSSPLRTIPQTPEWKKPAFPRRRIQLIPFTRPKTAAEQLRERFQQTGQVFEGFGIDSDDE